MWFEYFAIKCTIDVQENLLVFVLSPILETKNIHSIPVTML